MPRSHENNDDTVSVLQIVNLNQVKISFHLVVYARKKLLTCPNNTEINRPVDTLNVSFNGHSKVLNTSYIHTVFVLQIFNLK